MLDVTRVEGGAERGRGCFDSDRLRRLTAARPLTIFMHPLGQADRPRVEAFLEAAYVKAFEGHIRSHYPTLISVQDPRGVIHAAVGFRRAAEGRLFLEQYLDAPIEQAVAGRLGVAPARAEIAEIGNLASECAGASLTLFLALAGHLADEGCTHAVATATRQLRRSFARVGFVTEALTRAEPARLADGGADWGGYYARDPEVRVGAIAPALPALAQMLLGAPVSDRLFAPRAGQAVAREAAR